MRPWRDKARPKQLDPRDPRHCLPDAHGYRCGCTGTDDDFSIWLMMSGRGTGKTLSGANWAVEQALQAPGANIAVIAPTYRDVTDTCFSAVLSALEEHEIAPNGYNKSKPSIRLVNGSLITGFSADQPNRLRGLNLSAAWCDEMAAWRRPEAWYEGLTFAIRISTEAGGKPRVCITTTPKPTKLMRDIVSRKTTHITRGSTRENIDNLSAEAVQEMEALYGDSRVGRQELLGELLEDVEGALWNRALLDRQRVKKDQVPEDLSRIVVAIDPAVSSDEGSDETGIVVAGETKDRTGYILADLSMKGTPNECMKVAAGAYHEWKADCIVAETNNGGDYLRALLRTVDPAVPYRKVTATRGKLLRAQPVAAVYEQGRLFHAGVFPRLEDQMCEWTPDSKEGSPDRLDALVWACSELRGLYETDISGIYGLRRCGSCHQMTNRDETRCTRCGAEAAA